MQVHYIQTPACIININKFSTSLEYFLIFFLLSLGVLQAF